MELLPIRDLSQTEHDLLHEIYKNPGVIKHLQILAQNEIMELIQLSPIMNTDAAILKAHAVVHGKLTIINTLLSIADIPDPIQSPSQEQ